MQVGAVIPPHRGCIRREAPIHPKRPYSLTRPVVPPGRVFRFWRYFTQHDVRGRKLKSPPPRNAAMPVCRLTVDRKENPGVSTAFCRHMASGRGARWTKLKVFHKISPSRLIDSFRLRRRPFFLLTGWFMTHRLDVAHSRDIVAALVRSCRAAAGISHRIVRNRPLAAAFIAKWPFLRISRKPISRRNLARPVVAGGFSR